MQCLLLCAFTHGAYAQDEPLHEVPGHPAAIDFTLNDMDGAQHRLSQYRGKVVIINFWATWCPPCRFELPSMEKAYQILKEEGVVMLAINVGEDSDTIFNFTADYPVTFPLLLDKTGEIIRQYPVIGLPTSFIINPKGQMVYRVIGTREWADPVLLGKIRKLKP
jgi:peroxiredoxin